MRPLGLFFCGPVWLLAAWCELRQDFRAFRLDRMERLEVLPDRFPQEPGRSLQDFFDAVRAADPEVIRAVTSIGIST